MLNSSQAGKHNIPVVSVMDYQSRCPSLNPAWTENCFTNSVSLAPPKKLGYKISTLHKCTCKIMPQRKDQQPAFICWRQVKLTVYTSFPWLTPRVSSWIFSFAFSSFSSLLLYHKRQWNDVDIWVVRAMPNTHQTLMSWMLLVIREYTKLSLAKI